MIKRLFGAMLLASLMLLAAPTHASDRAPKLLAMMSAGEVLRAIRCSIPITCDARKPQKSIRKRK